MQNNTIKIIVIFFSLIFVDAKMGFSQGFELDLQVADSLFEARKFTESFGIYEAILETGEMQSPAMLLKMAYIKEGLGDYSQALYFLNSYYLQTSDDHVLSKMETLADKNRLSGFKNNDGDRFLNYYFKYFNFIVGGLIVTTAFFFFFFGYQLKIKKRKSLGSALTVLVLLGVLFYVINLSRNYDQAIIANNNVYIMTGPSAGSEVVAIPNKGHKVRVLESVDVWTKIIWDDQIGFVKSSALKEINF